MYAHPVLAEQAKKHFTSLAQKTCEHDWWWDLQGINKVYECRVCGKIEIKRLDHLRK